MQYNLTDAVFKKGKCAESTSGLLSGDNHASTKIMAT